jgi:predicted nucleotidyltransferase
MKSDAQQQGTTGTARHDVLQRLEAHREELEAMGVRYLAIFGSVARDEAGPNSDVDILVDLERPAGLLSFARLQNYLASLLGRKVDVVPRDSVRPQLEARIGREALRVL